MKNLKIHDYFKIAMSLSLIGLTLMSFSGCVYNKDANNESDIKPSPTPTTMSTVKPTIKPDFPETTIVPFDIGKHFAIVEIERKYSYASKEYMYTSPIIPDGYEFVDYETPTTDSYTTREMVFINFVPILLEGTYNDHSQSYDFKKFGTVDPDYIDEFGPEEELFPDINPKRLLYGRDIY